METSTILTADVLDIIFDGRNKEYGAYDLRRTYRRRLTLSITVMLSVICMFFIGFAFAGKKTQVDPGLFIKELELASVPPPEKTVEPQLPPPAQKPAVPPVQVQMIKHTAYHIVPDKEVPENERPPEMAEMETAQIGKFNQDGQQYDGTVIAPPGEGDGKGIVEAPRKEEEDWNKTFTKVEIESEYPGGRGAWERFLKKNLRYPQEAIDQEIQGFVMVQFIVDRQGNVSDVEAVSGPQELRAEAVRVIKKSGTWTPAIQNGNPVRSYKKQPVGFQLANE